MVRRCSARFAERVMVEVGDDLDRQIKRVYRLALARRPSSQELKRARAALTTLAAH